MVDELFREHRKIDGVVIVECPDASRWENLSCCSARQSAGFCRMDNLRFIVNLAGASYIDSGGLGELMASLARVRNRAAGIFSTSLGIY
jgi:hypothetical protein